MPRTYCRRCGSGGGPGLGAPHAKRRRRPLRHRPPRFVVIRLPGRRSFPSSSGGRNRRAGQRLAPPRRLMNARRAPSRSCRIFLAEHPLPHAAKAASDDRNFADSLGVRGPDNRRLTMQCAFCGRSVDPKSTWKAAADRFYCSEFCADSETTEPAAAPETADPLVAPSTLLERHRNRPYERLERLLPYMRQYSSQAFAVGRQRA